jgi:hypothetical protein
MHRINHTHTDILRDNRISGSVGLLYILEFNVILCKFCVYSLLKRCIKCYGLVNKIHVCRL